MHVEGFSGVQDGIELGFTYGAQMAKTGPWGFRVFTLRENEPRAYETVLYRCEGSALLGTARATEEERHDYRAGQSSFFDFFLRFFSLFSSLISAVIQMFR